MKYVKGDILNVYICTSKVTYLMYIYVPMTYFQAGPARILDPFFQVVVVTKRRNGLSLF